METTVSKVKVIFSNSDDEELIEIVSSYQLLWKLDHPDYKNNLKKDMIWNKIGVSINKTGEQCKSRWRSIRDNFKRHRKSEIYSTGQPAKKKRATYWGRLRFLDDVHNERQGFTNSEEQNTDLPGTNTFDIPNESLLGEAEVIEQVREEIDTPNCSSREDVQVDRSVTEEIFKLKTGKRVKNCVGIVEIMKRKAEAQENLVKCIEKLITPVESAPEDDIDVFFKSIGLTIKQFTPMEKAEAKRKIFNIVNDMELRHHSQAGCSIQMFNYQSPSTISSVVSNASTTSAIDLQQNNVFPDEDVLFSY